MKDIRLTTIRRTVLSSTVLLAAACVLFQSCEQDEFGEPDTDPAALIDTGRYLVAKRIAPESRAEADVWSYRSTWFESGTPYRLLAFTKPDDAAADVEAGFLRFNEVAWEGCTTDSLHYLNIQSDPGLWFGFDPVFDNEAAGASSGRVSLDFYGFTYGLEVAPDNRTDYIKLESQSGSFAPGSNVDVSKLYRSEPVPDGGRGELPDLLWGTCLNRNITSVTADNARSVIPFKHCFSRLRFLVVQQSPADSDGGTATESFPGIKVTDIKVTNTYTKAQVNLKDARIKLGIDGETPTKRTLKMDAAYLESGCVVNSTQSEVGHILVYPTDGAVMADPAMAQGYDTGLEITVQCDKREVIEKFLNNTNDEASRTVTANADGTFSGVLIKKTIINLNDDARKPLRLEQGTSYTLVISFQEDAVRIVTVIPQVEPWLPGEGDATLSYQTQVLGQPEMFDNIYWSDRNLGADHYDPRGEHFEGTVGYFYQSGRNIPYYPFDTGIYKGVTYPSYADNDKSVLADVEAYYHTRHKFYPIIDEKVLNMLHQTITDWDTQKGDNLWVMSKDYIPQVFVPQTKQDGTNGTVAKYLDFMLGGSNWAGLAECKTSIPGQKGADVEWHLGASRQPVAGGWQIPSTADFRRIFPSTPFAGNICVRGGGNSSAPMDGWGLSELYWENGTKVNTLRVTVPFYNANDRNEPSDRSDNYRKAWRTLDSNDDPGTTHLSAYVQRPDTWSNLQTEPDGDPADGYASVYVISREAGSVDSLDDAEYNPDNATYNKADYVNREWGTIYAIKRIYTPYAYRMRWRVVCAGLYGTSNSPGLYIEISRYRATSTDELTETNYMKYDWQHPAGVLYLPICGLGDHDGYYINFGTECQYAVSDKADGWRVPGVHIKISGDNNYNLFMSVVSKPVFNRTFAKQIRPVMK